MILVLTSLFLSNRSVLWKLLVTLQEERFPSYLPTKVLQLLRLPEIPHTDLKYFGRWSNESKAVDSFIYAELNFYEVRDKITNVSLVIVDYDSLLLCD